MTLIKKIEIIIIIKIKDMETIIIISNIKTVILTIKGDIIIKTIAITIISDKIIITNPKDKIILIQEIIIKDKVKGVMKRKIKDIIIQDKGSIKGNIPEIIISKIITKSKIQSNMKITGIK